MRMRYETEFGIYDHEGPENPEVPFPLLYLSPKESLSHPDPLDFRLDQFAENKVREIFGFSFDELIHYPRRDYLKVIQLAKKHNAILSASGGKQLKDLESQLAKLKQGK